MSNHTITLNVPEYVYDRARKLAETTSEPIERVLVRKLEAALSEPLPTLPPDEQAELDAFQNYSDEALWVAAREQMPADKQARLQVLMDANSERDLAENEEHEFSRLVEDGQRLMLRKAQAAAFLTKRGFTINPSQLS